jgi:peptidoglycan-associated lipoprotein
MSRMTPTVVIVSVLLTLAGSACSRRRPPATPAPTPTFETPAAVTPSPPPAPPQRVDDAQPIAPSLGEDSIGNKSLDDLNRDSPLRPAFFGLDSFDLDDEGRAIVTANAAVLKKYSTWVISVEGHCDERGTPEYNLALGERRAMSVKTYLVSLGISPDRVRTVSYGKEFPFDAGHSEDAWSKNRRAHFVITSK